MVWVCGQCTLINDDAVVNCSVCNWRRERVDAPAPAAVGGSHQPKKKKRIREHTADVLYVLPGQPATSKPRPGVSTCAVCRTAASPFGGEGGLTSVRAETATRIQETTREWAAVATVATSEKSKIAVRFAKRIAEHALPTDAAVHASCRDTMTGSKGQLTRLQAKLPTDAPAAVRPAATPTTRSVRPMLAEVP